MGILLPEDRKRLLGGGANKEEVDEYDELAEMMCRGLPHITIADDFRLLERFNELFNKLFGRLP